MEDYDVIIVGSGPAGLTASIYASCFHLKNLAVGNRIGGQLQLAPHILNYPGFKNINGKELTQRMVDQAKSMGGIIVTQNVTKILKFTPPLSEKNSKNNKTGFEVETQEGNKYSCKAVILATGMERRKLNIPGEVEYTSRGVHYCATCEKFDYQDKICAVIGGANSAVQAAVELAQAAAKVYVIYRGNELRGDPIWLEQIAKNPKIEVLFGTGVLEISGNGDKVTEVKVKSTEVKSLAVDKVFIEIGGVPGTALVIPLGVKMDRGGYIVVDDTLSTNIPGIFAAGDLVSYGLSIEQISTAVGLGARAASSAFAYIKESKAPVLWGQRQIES